MSELVKAQLQEISSDDQRQPIGDPFPVQFNPTSLKLKLTNQIEGGDSSGRQARQYIGSSSAVLTLELVFDTADEGTADEPRSVREKTTALERFILPTEAGAEETVPKLQFQWGELVFEGIVEGLDLDFDHFAADGTPLRAKVNLSIKEQDAEYQFLESGPGANDRTATPEPGQAPVAAPGSQSSAGGDFSALALAGETAAEFAARMGLDPGAWRGLDIDLSAGFSLEAGLEVGFSAGLSAGLGVGVNVGVEAGAEASVEAAFGLEVQAGATAGLGVAAGANADPEVASGFALAAAGGVATALESVQIARSAAASEASLDAFGVPANGGGSGAVMQTGASSSGRVPIRPERAEQKRIPLTFSGARSPAQQEAAESAPPPPTADLRAATYGFGVPLRSRIWGAAQERPSAAGGVLVVGRRASGSTVEVSRDPTEPFWVRLPARDRGRQRADEIQAERSPSRPCGCSGRCGGHGGQR